MRRRAALLAPLLAAAASASAAPPIPAAGVPDGWAPAGPERVFTGSGLYGHIDGGAEIFFEFGFEEATVQRYAAGGETVEVEAYRMADPEAALGIFLQRCGNRCEPPGSHPGFPAYTTIGRTQLMFARDRVLAVVTADGAGGKARDALPAFAAELAKRLPPDQPPDPGAALPPGWTPGSLRLIRGPLALQSIVTLGDGDVLRLGGRLTAAAADYAGAPGRPAHTLVFAEYADEGAARDAFRRVRGGLDAEIAVLRETTEAFVFRDSAGRFGVAATAGRRLTLRLNLASDPGPAR